MHLSVYVHVHSCVCCDSCSALVLLRTAPAVLPEMTYCINLKTLKKPVANYLTSKTAKTNLLLNYQNTVYGTVNDD